MTVIRTIRRKAFRLQVMRSFFKNSGLVFLSKWIMCIFTCVFYAVESSIYQQHHTIWAENVQDTLLVFLICYLLLFSNLSESIILWSRGRESICRASVLAGAKRWQIVMEQLLNLTGIIVLGILSGVSLCSILLHAKIIWFSGFAPELKWMGFAPLLISCLCELYTALYSVRAAVIDLGG